MKSIQNSVTLIGNLGHNPESRTLENGTKWVKVSLATTDTSIENDVKVTETHWHNLVAYGKVAELLEKHTKLGDKIAVEGKLVNRQYTTKDGSKKYVTEVHLNEIILLKTHE